MSMRQSSRSKGGGAAPGREAAAVAAAEVSEAPNGSSSSDESRTKKIVVRAKAASAMMIGFCLVVWAGHMYVWLLVILLQNIAFREMVNVRYREYKEQMDVRMPLFRTLQWCWYGVSLLFVYGEFFSSYATTHESAAWMMRYTKHQPWVTFMCYCALFMVSVSTLEAESVKYQVGQLSWTIVTILIIVGQMKFVANNIFEGLFWFFFPVWLVINNDCWAYFWGMLMGKRFVKRPFFSLSPKKTWEGFIGALFSTVLVGYHSAAFFATFPWLTCPAMRLTFEPHALSDCVPMAVFQPQRLVLAGVTFPATMPIQLHAVALALFASIVAPFGGFLASAIKRAYHVKDFNSLIPGHGGVTDRVDCQFIVQLFVYVYFKAFIREYDVDWRKVYSMALLLTQDQQAALLEALHTRL